MENNNNEIFNYTYSAKQQDEIKSIRSKYLPPQEDKMAILRRLDKGVYNKATTVALILGIIGTLIMGGGMSLCMTVAGAWFFPGIAIGLLGMVLMGLAYPAYTVALKKERQRIAPQILSLTDELMK